MVEPAPGPPTVEALACDRAKGGLKRSHLADGVGIPLATVSALANTRNDALLPATLDAVTDFQPLQAEVTVHLDAGYDYRPCREALAERAARRDRPPRHPRPDPGGRRWVVEHTNAWLNDFGKLRR